MEDYPVRNNPRQDLNIVRKDENSQFFNWHDILLICNAVGLFCIALICIIMLMLFLIKFM